MKSSYVPTESLAVDATTARASSPAWEVEEGDIRVLSEYNGDEGIEGLTLVGIGPPSSRSPVVLTEPLAAVRATPRSEPPGPWGSDEDEEVPPSLRRRRAGIWTAAVPLLLVAAAVVVFALQSLAPSSRQAPTLAARAPERLVTEGTGLFVRLTNPDVRVTLDGVDRGPPPLLLMDLTPDSHVITISGAGFAPYEQTVTLIANHVSTLEPVLLTATVDVDTASASAAPRDEPVASEDEQSHASNPVPPSEGAARTSARAVKAAAIKLDETPENPYLATTPGLLAASSSPPASVVVDGRPLGTSPRAVDLAPGVHTVALVHPTLGRRSMTVNVLPGKTTNVAVEF